MRGSERPIVSGNRRDSLSMSWFSAAPSSRRPSSEEPLSRLSVPSIITTRQIPTGDLTLAHGAESDRVISDATLRRYECAEHIGVLWALLRARSVERQDWRGRTVVLIGSRGDVVSPPARLRNAEKRLRARGAMVRTDILPWDLPHAFLAFGTAAQRVAEIAGQLS
jgi:acetyl esterase/lipase